MNPLPKKSLLNIYEINEINMEIKIEKYFSRFIYSMYALKSHSEIENLLYPVQIWTPETANPLFLILPMLADGNSVLLMVQAHGVTQASSLSHTPTTCDLSGNLVDSTSKRFPEPSGFSIGPQLWVGSEFLSSVTAVAFGPVPHFVQKQEDSSRTYQTRSLGVPNPPKTPIFSEWKPQALAQPTRPTRTWVPPTRPLGHTSPASSPSGSESQKQVFLCSSVPSPRACSPEFWWIPTFFKSIQTSPTLQCLPHWACHLLSPPPWHAFRPQNCPALPPWYLASSMMSFSCFIEVFVCCSSLPMEVKPQKPGCLHAVCLLVFRVILGTEEAHTTQIWGNWWLVLLFLWPPCSFLATTDGLLYLSHH